MVIDLGTGDGRAVLALAAADPRALVLGVDASAGAMAEASRRAVRGRTRLPNALFLVEAAERLPGPLGEVADQVTITMPWGSLLRGVLGRDAEVLAGIASIVRHGGRVELLASVLPSDGVEGVAALGDDARSSLAGAWRSFGFELVEMRAATRADLVASRSSWARRLGDRPIWRLVLDRRASTGRRPGSTSRSGRRCATLAP